MGNQANHAKPENREVTASVIGQELRVFARTKWPLANDKYRKATLRRLLNLTPRRIRSFWEGETTAVPRAEETARIERLIGKKIGAVADVEEANRYEFQDLQARIARLEAALFQSDEEFHQPQMAGLRQASYDGRRNHVSDHAGGSTGDEELPISRWRRSTD